MTASDVTPIRAVSAAEKTEKMLPFLEKQSERSQRPIRDVAKDYGIAPEELHDAIAAKPEPNGLDIARLQGHYEGEKILLRRLAQQRGEKADDITQVR